MTFLFEVTAPHIIYAALGGFVVFFGMFSLFIREKLYIGEACWAFLFGVIIGPYGANIFDPRGWGGGHEETTNTITLEFTRVVLAIGVFAIGVELPKQYMKKHWKSIFFLLAPIMTYGWFVCAAFIYALIPDINFLSALVIAACLTPTDPILAAAVVGGKYADKHVPAHLRHLLAAESGCNDGAAFPFLFIGLYLTLDRSTGIAIKDWFLLLWLYQIVLGTVIGALIGFGFRHLMKFCERKELVDRQSYVAQYVSLALLTIGVCTLLGSDDLLAAFACGTAFAWDGFFNKQTEESVFSSVIDLLFNIAAFVFVGAWMPFNDFHAPELSLSVWRLIVIAILVLLFRRLPVMIALYRWIPDVKTFREAIFSGHFGPIGIGAVFISTLAAERLPHPHSPPQGQAELVAATIQPIVAFMVLCSILVHGLSIPFFSLGRRVHSVRREWSRRSTIDASGGPEWANQVRRVREGESIVINRDNLAERGEIPREEIDRGEKGTREPSPESELTAGEVEKARLRDAAPTEDGAPDEKQKEENPPDGEEVINEWKEGPHKVVEKRAGPGEEVEVEVQKNAFADEDRPRMTSIFKGEGEMVHKTTRAHLDKLHELGKQALGEAHVPAANAPSSSRPSTADTAVVKAARSGPPSPEDEDEGWQSDQSSGEPSTSALVPPDPVERTSPSPKPHAKKKHLLPLHVRSRRRNSVRRIPAVHVPEAAAEQEERGRRHEPGPAAARGSLPRKGPTSHLDRVRSLESRSRGVSPARSIRWADDGAASPRESVLLRDGTGTPRHSVPTSPSSPADDTEGARHVVFDLPSSGPRTPH